MDRKSAVSLNYSVTHSAVDSSGEETENRIMGQTFQWVGRWIGALLVLCWAAGAGAALAQERTREYEEEPSTRRTPPPAAKSVEIGTFYLKQKKYKAALSRFQEAIQTDPLYAPAYRKLGKVYLKLGRKKEALRAYKRHLELLPSAREAEKATDVHKAIARLERELGSGKMR